MPISHFLVRPRRRAAEKTNAAIDASVRELACVSRLGIVKKKRNKYKTSSSTLFIYLPWALVQRYPPYPDSCEEVNVWAMSSLLGVWYSSD